MRPGLDAMRAPLHSSAIPQRASRVTSRVQRQGLDRGDVRGGASGGRAERGTVYLAAPLALHRARAHRGRRAGARAPGRARSRVPRRPVQLLRGGDRDCVPRLARGRRARGGGGGAWAGGSTPPPCAALAAVDDRHRADHTELLGETLPAIAREKAGIFKPGVPRFIGLVPPEADAELVRAEGRGRRAAAPTGTRLRRAVGPIALPGAHQGDNAALAVELARRLASSWPADRRRSAGARAGRRALAGPLEPLGDDLLFDARTTPRARGRWRRR